MPGPQPTHFDLLADPHEPHPGRLDVTPGSAASDVTVLRGVIDLVYRADDGWRIVDYKTDQILVEVGELVARYGTQIERYREAWQVASGEPVPIAELFHVRTLQSVPV
jgi:ATP-dependent exoDNAse (exonuclease V) beta subunit